jgi:hypothetical protein
MGSISEVDTINRLGSQQQQQLARAGKIPTAGSACCRMMSTLLFMHEVQKVNSKGDVAINRLSLCKVYQDILF